MIEAGLIESDLICCEQMLETEYDVTQGGISSPIKKLIDYTCEELGISLTEYVSEKQCELLESKIAARKMIIWHIDSRCLAYSPIFRQKITVHTNHYINVIGLDGSRYLISDSYIPTIPSSTHEGLIEVSEENINKSAIFILEPGNVRARTEDERRDCVQQSLVNYFNYRNKSIENFEKLSNDIISVMNGDAALDASSCMLEMASCLIVSGLYASRVLFLEAILHSSMPGNKKEIANREITELCDMYMSLKLLLTKCSFSNRKADYLAALNRLNSIKEKEIYSFQTLV